MARNVIPFQELRMSDVEQVGGKNASLGEMISQLPASVRVPGGFATTADAYRKFLSHQGLAERISTALESLDVDDVVSLARCGAQIRQWIVDTPFPAELEAEIKAAYDQLTAEGDGSFAVRSSATAEDLPDASFAGQQESFLNIHGYQNILHASRKSSRRSTTTAPSLTACTRASPTLKWPCRPACSAWSAPTSAPPA